MNLSDDVSGATLQIGMKAAETALNIAERTASDVINDIARLLRFLGKSAVNGLKNMQSTDLTDIKSGEVSVKELFSSAKKSADSVSFSENGLTSKDKQFIISKSKEYGIPVAFTQDSGKDNFYAHVRSSDLPAFQRICNDLIKDKIASRPQELGNFKVKSWEIPFIQKELNNHDLSAHFGKMKDGQYFCLFEKNDEKAILIARNEFVRKANEVKNDIHFDKDEEGLLTIKDIRTGKEISFEKDNLPIREDLSEMMQNEFGYDRNKADIACARFGQEQLDGDLKKNFFSDNPKDAFSKINTNITLSDENIFTRQFTCLRVVSSKDKKPYIVFQSPEGRMAVISPERMTNAKMFSIVSEGLGISDKKEIKQIIDKAQKVTVNFAKEDAVNYSYEAKFSKSDFDMTNPNVVSNMRRVDETGNIFTKSLPVDKLNVDIERINKGRFRINSNATYLETDSGGKYFSANDSKSLVLSFSDRKNAIHELVEIFKSQGVPEDSALQIAKETLKKAENQNAEKMLILEEIRADETYYENCEIEISCGNQTETISLKDSEKAKIEIQDKFGASPEATDAIIDKADKKLSELQQKKLEEFGFNKEKTENWTRADAHEVLKSIEDNGWKRPDNLNPAEYIPGSMRETGIKPELIKPELSDISKSIGSVVKSSGGRLIR